MLSVNVDHDNGVICCTAFCGNGHFAFDVLHFCTFLLNPTSILNLTISTESQWNIDSNDMFSVCKYCQLFTRVSNTFLGKQCHSAHSNEWGRKCWKMPETPLPLEACGPHLVHQCLSPPHSPPQMTAQSLYAFPHNDATKAPLVTMGCPKFTAKSAPFPRWSPTNLIHPSLDWPHSPPQTAHGSNQPFCHNTLCGPTDRWVYPMVQANVLYHERSARYADRERHANNASCSLLFIC